MVRDMAQLLLTERTKATGNSESEPPTEPEIIGVHWCAISSIGTILLTQNTVVNMIMSERNVKIQKSSILGLSVYKGYSKVWYAHALDS